MHLPTDMFLHRLPRAVAQAPAQKPCFLCGGLCYRFIGRTESAQNVREGVLVAEGNAG